MVSHKEYFLNTVDGTKLYTQSWNGANDAKAVVCFVHELGGHSGRFERFAKMFIKNDIAVSAYDIRGNGKSEGKRGFSPSYNTLLKDLEIFYRATKTTFKNIPVIFMGHGLGGNLVINFVIRKKPKIAGIISTSPWLKLDNNPIGLNFQLGKILHYIIPWYSFRSGHSEIEMSDKKHSLIDLNSDVLLHNRTSYKLYNEAHKNGLWALKNIYKINIPFLLLYGKEDRFTSSKACEEYVNNTSEKTRLIIFEGFGHNLYNALGSTKIHKTIVDWLKDNCNIAGEKVKADEFIPHRSIS